MDHDQSKRRWQGIPGVERTAGGRLYVTWFSGGDKEPHPENTVYLCSSDDGGQTFSEPQPVARPQEGSRAFDPTLWIDPHGTMWLFFNRGNDKTAQHGVYARQCKDPDAAVPAWGDEFPIAFDAPYSFRLNKPTVLTNGDWILPVTHALEPVHGWFAGERQLQGAAVSSDQGQTWSLSGSVLAPHWALENMVVERKDGQLWMLIRTGDGCLWESFSSDSGRSWSEARATTIANPGSRFFIRRLSSGNLLLVNHYRYTGRSHLTAQVSTDDGDSWNDGLLLDERTGVSYPDGVEDDGGTLWIVYDRDRQGDGEILLATFTEADVQLGTPSPSARLKHRVAAL